MAARADDDELGQCEQDLCEYPQDTAEHKRRELVTFCQECWHFTLADFQRNKGTIAALEQMT